MRWYEHYTRCFQHYTQWLEHYMRCFHHYMRCFHHYMRCFQHYTRWFEHYTRCFQHYTRWLEHYMQCFRHYTRCFCHYTLWFEHDTRCFQHYTQWLEHYMRCFRHYMRCFRHYMRWFEHYTQCFQHYTRCFHHYTNLHHSVVVSQYVWTAVNIYFVISPQVAQTLNGLYILNIYTEYLYVIIFNEIIQKISTIYVKYISNLLIDAFVVFLSLVNARVIQLHNKFSIACFFLPVVTKGALYKYYSYTTFLSNYNHGPIWLDTLYFTFIY